MACAEIILSNAIEYLKDGSGLEKVVFCVFGDAAFAVFKETLGRLTK